MRIISKTHDYYDSVQGYGQDQTTLYLRKQEPVDKVFAERLTQFSKSMHGAKDWNGWSWSTRTSPNDFIDLKCKDYSRMFFRTGMVIFCGKIYRYFKVRLEPIRKYSVFEPTTEVVEHFYNLKDLVEFLHSYGKVVQDIYRRKFSNETLGVERLTDFLSRQGTDELEEEFIKKRLITVRWTLLPDTVNQYAWQKDVPLKDVDFYRVKDPYAAFQELDMYLSGVLGQQEKEIINISDKDRIGQHGFDQYSFRKMPDEKGRKKKQNV